MDSGNSGSMQSSSGGDEEYDSRAESISAFLNPPSSHLGPLPNHPQQPPHHHHHHHHQAQSSSSSSMFDPLSNYFDQLSSSRSVPLTNPNSFLNLDMVWSKTLRSDPNATDLCGLITPSSSAQSQPFLTSQLGGQSRDGSFCAIQIPPAPENSPRASVSASGISGANDQAGGNNNNVVRNPKKRSRASRRAPTTVLTTDTTNFRAMVQEFTGIPAPPFTSSPFPRSRLDLFGTASSSLRSGHLDPAQPPYLLRPFAQKVQPPPFLSSSPSSSSSAPSLSFPSSSMLDVLGSDSTSNASHSTSINYQLSSDLGILKQPHNLLNMNMQNPILNLHNLLQTQPKYTQSTSALLSSKTQGSLEIPPNDSHLKMGNVLEELGLSHQHVGTQLSGLSNIVSSDGTFSRNENNPPTSWANDTGPHGGDQGLLRSLNGSYGNSERITNGKTLNYSAASSSGFHGDKGPENVTTRSEGMVESWICSSD
ncbi:transcription factor MYB120-like [Carya illinoinensis]|uniref:transcription factor MYB120-like n=1 Tax=Carya illinoinensis TaxID=32201 RepID=UPI001C71FEF3|nr:transcription factor MYB120-like [Carya illinoinensis]